MHQMQWQEHTKWSSPSLRNPTKATNAMEGFKRKNKEKNTKQLQDLNQRCSPHLEEIWFGGIIDLGLLLQSSKDQRVWVEGLGDLSILSLQEMEFFNGELAEMAEGRWRGINTPPQ